MPSRRTLGGNKEGKLSLTKRGPAQVRQLMYMAALRLVKDNPIVVSWYRARSADTAEIKTKASEGLRAEVKRHGIHVVTVYPGPVTSDMEAAGRAAYEDRASARHAPTGTPEVLARMIADAVARKRPRVIYPRLYGLARHFPNMTRWALDALTPPLKQMKP